MLPMELEVLLSHDGISSAGIEWQEIDKEALGAMITEAEAINLDDYLSEGKEAFQNALAEAKVIYANESATQEEVNQALNDLRDAYDGLKEKEKTVDKSELKEILDKYKDLVQGDNVSVSWEAFVTAWNNAMTILNDESTTQGEVERVLTELKAAYENLEYKDIKEAAKQNCKKFITVIKI